MEESIEFDDEWQLELYCADYAFEQHRLGSIHIDHRNDPRLEKGYPDRIFFGTVGEREIVFFVEFKDLGKPAKELQKRVHERIRRLYDLGVYVVDSFEAFDEALKDQL